MARMYRPGHAFIKAGIGFLEITSKHHLQADLLTSGQSAKADKLMEIIDKVNQREGRGTIFLGAQGVGKPWAMRQQHAPQRYATRCGDIPLGELFKTQGWRGDPTRGHILGVTAGR